MSEKWCVGVADVVFLRSLFTVGGDVIIYWSPVVVVDAVCDDSPTDVREAACVG